MKENITKFIKWLSPICPQKFLIKMEVLTMKICDILNNNESENLLKEWLEE